MVPGRKEAGLISAVIVLCLGVGMVGLAVQQSRSAGRETEATQAKIEQNAETARAQHQSLIAGCERGNALRAQIGQVQTALKTNLVYFASQVEASIARGDTPSTAIQRRRALAFAAHERAQAAAIRIVQPIDCAEAFPVP